MSVRKKPQPKDGPPPGRYGVYTRYGHYVGHVGAKGTAATCLRFGAPHAELTTVNGRKAWQGRAY